MFIFTPTVIKTIVAIAIPSEIMILSINSGTFEGSIEKYINVAFILNIIISLGIAIATIVLITVGVNMNIYSDIYNDNTIVQQIFICIFIFITQFYSFSTFIGNTIIF